MPVRYPPCEGRCDEGVAIAPEAVSQETCLGALCYALLREERMSGLDCSYGDLPDGSRNGFRSEGSATHRVSPIRFLEEARPKV